jgi:hypothetical protein
LPGFLIHTIWSSAQTRGNQYLIVVDYVQHSVTSNLLVTDKEMGLDAYSLPIRLAQAIGVRDVPPCCIFCKPCHH